LLIGSSLGVRGRAGADDANEIVGFGVRHNDEPTTVSYPQEDESRLPRTALALGS
jgi:hypothetical protein